MAELRNISEEERRKRRLQMSDTERFRLFMMLHRLGMKLKQVGKNQSRNGHSG